jgi:hypothetical protein
MGPSHMGNPMGMSLSNQTIYLHSRQITPQSLDFQLSGVVRGRAHIKLVIGWKSTNLIGHYHGFSLGAKSQVAKSLALDSSDSTFTEQESEARTNTGRVLEHDGSCERCHSREDSQFAATTWNFLYMNLPSARPWQQVRAT